VRKGSSRELLREVRLSVQVERAGEGMSRRDYEGESQEAEERGTRWEDQGMEERDERVIEVKVRRCEEMS